MLSVQSPYATHTATWPGTIIAVIENVFPFVIAGRMAREME
jgi:hypothetical protein